MNFLKEIDDKWVAAGLGVLAVLGSFVAAAIVYAILEAIGLNDGWAWGLSMLAWIVVLAVAIRGVISFYGKYASNRTQQVTIIREVIAPPPFAPELPKVEPVTRPVLDEPSHTGVVSENYRSILSEENNTDGPETKPLQDKLKHPNDAPVRRRGSVLDRGSKDDESR